LVNNGDRIWHYMSDHLSYGGSDEWPVKMGGKMVRMAWPAV
jgi:hypothetical protein